MTSHAVADQNIKQTIMFSMLVKAMGLLLLFGMAVKMNGQMCTIHSTGWQGG